MISLIGYKLAAWHCQLITLLIRSQSCVELPCDQVTLHLFINHKLIFIVT